MREILGRFRENGGLIGRRVFRKLRGDDSIEPFAIKPGVTLRFELSSDDEIFQIVRVM